MRPALFLARRFLSGRKGNLLGTVATLALCGVALGAAALVVAMGLMSGYRNELADKLAGTSAEVLIAASQDDGGTLQESLAKLPGVVAVARTAFAPGLLVSEAAEGGTDALLKGLDLPAGLQTTRLLGSIPDLEALLVQASPARGAPSGRAELASGGTPGVPVLLGAGLAQRVGVGVGGRVILETASVSLSRGISPPRRTVLRVVALAETGFSEVDDGWAVLPLAAFERLAPPDARRGLYELKLERASLSAETVSAARQLLGSTATILDARSLNRDLFTALLVQQTLLFVALALIVAVAAGTVVSSLVVLLARKTRDVGVLFALGAPPSLVWRTFLVSGLFLGGSGLVLGTLFGLLACFVLTAGKLVRFPPEIAKVYYLSWMPFRPEPAAIVAILAVGIVLVLLASVLPARRAARLPASEALRYE